MVDKKNFGKLWEMVESLHGVEQNPAWHPEGDALVHTMQVIHHALREAPTPELLIAAMCHDLGKTIGSHGHEQHGGALIAPIVGNDKHGLDIVWLVANHMRALQWQSGGIRRPGKGRSFYESDLFCDVILLSRWDRMGRQGQLTVNYTSADVWERYREMCDVFYRR